MSLHARHQHSVLSAPHRNIEEQGKKQLELPSSCILSHFQYRLDDR